MTQAPQPDPAPPASAAAHVLRHTRAWALFVVDDDGVRLLASDHIDQRSLDDVLSHAAPRRPLTFAHPASETEEEAARCRLILALPEQADVRQRIVFYLEGPPPYTWLSPLLDLDIRHLGAVRQACSEAQRDLPRRIARNLATIAAHESAFLLLPDQCLRDATA